MSIPAVLGPGHIQAGQLSLIPFHSIIGVNIITVILTGIVFFAVFSWYNAVYDLYRYWWEEIRTDYKVSIKFAILWTILTVIILISAYYILEALHRYNPENTAASTPHRVEMDMLQA